MNIFVILFIVLYLECLVSYFFSETSGNFKRRAINKIILASLFFIFGLVMFSLNYSFTSYHVIMLLAITFAYIGDILLLFSFTKGGISFITSNVLFFIYHICLIINYSIPFYKIFYFLFLLILIFSIFYILNMNGKIDLKNKKAPTLLYIFSVTLSATLSISLAFYLQELSFYMLALGLTLFMISDYFLIAYKFKFSDKKWVLRCNSGFYFIGLLLVVLSLMY